MPASKKERQSAKERIQRTEAYADKVRRQFAGAVNDILALNKRLPELPEGQMYSFDGAGKKMRSEVDSILRELHSATVATVRTGITQEWNEANKAVDEILASALGRRALSNPNLAGWFDRNEKAMDAFLKRTQDGFNLSRRIWNTTTQLREEMEVAMTVAIGEGESASAMSRRVRQYLNDPDLMFRRFRYKDDEGNWQRKWKKKVVDSDGHYHFVDYDRDSYKVGRGMYKSAYKNAMRVTRTETNIAYRRADHERWQQLDFVLGQRIQTSNSHPKEDICDELAGDYPKDFVFDGWHPQCFCICTPIMADEEEMKKEMEAVLNGEEYEPSYKPITTYPEGFQKFLDENREKIEQAQKARTAPYFIENNAYVVQRRYEGEDLTNGGAVPPTLQHLDVAIREFPFSDPKLKERENEINAAMKELFDNSDFGMELRDREIESVLEGIYDKGFQNQFVTGTSSFLMSSNTKGLIEENNPRLVASHRMFDGNSCVEPAERRGLLYTGKQLSRAEYEKYGCLMEKDKYKNYAENGAGYGGVHVRFKKDNVKCTWTFGDSIMAARGQDGKYFQPSMTDDPKVESFNGYIQKSADELLGIIDKQSVVDFRKGTGTAYIELQYHGQLTLDDVESITFSQDPSELDKMAILQEYEKNGVEMWYISGDKARRYHPSKN